MNIASVFLPVSDPSIVAEWYRDVLDLRIASSDDHAAVLETSDPVRRLTLLGPPSGIKADPGLPWAPVSFLVEDLAAAHARLSGSGVAVGAVDGDDQTCLWFTAEDPDGNTLLFVDR
ncbi:VOC family protein [Antribacter gilvus]|uniref:VOC family protein n=1 Tax=Antribacter gilvus TaxID=2304675 RepID=UPI000F7A4639|nr:VOC family protein [Antribacter gilvus]